MAITKNNIYTSSGKKILSPDSTPAPSFTPAPAATQTYSWTGKTSDQMSLLEKTAYLRSLGNNASSKDAYAALASEMQSVGSRHYSPYLINKSNQKEAVAFFGIDSFDQNWMDANRGLLEYTNQLDMTDTVSTSGKNNWTQSQWAGYYYHMLTEAEETTKSAESEWSQLRSDMQRNYNEHERLYGEAPSYDKLMSYIDMGDYPTLTKMDGVYDNIENLVRLNRPVNYTPETVLGVYSALKSGKDVTGDGDYFEEAIQYTMQPVINQPERVYPDVEKEGYFGGQTIDDNFFKKYSYLDEYVEGMKDKDGKIDAPDKSDPWYQHAAYEYHQLKKRDETTKKAEEELASLSEQLIRLRDASVPSDSALSSINWKMYPTLEKIREGEEGNILLNRPIDASDEALELIWNESVSQQPATAPETPQKASGQEDEASVAPTLPDDVGGGISSWFFNLFGVDRPQSEAEKESVEQDVIHPANTLYPENNQTEETSPLSELLNKKPTVDGEYRLTDDLQLIKEPESRADQLQSEIEEQWNDFMKPQKIDDVLEQKLFRSEYGRPMTYAELDAAGIKHDGLPQNIDYSLGLGANKELPKDTIFDETFNNIARRYINQKTGQAYENMDQLLANDPSLLADIITFAEDEGSNILTAYQYGFTYSEIVHLKELSDYQDELERGLTDELMVAYADANSVPEERLNAALNYVIETGLTLEDKAALGLLNDPFQSHVQNSLDSSEYVARTSNYVISQKGNEFMRSAAISMIGNLGGNKAPSETQINVVAGALSHIFALTTGVTTGVMKPSIAMTQIGRDVWAAAKMNSYREILGDDYTLDEACEIDPILRALDDQATIYKNLNSAVTPDMSNYKYGANFTRMITEEISTQKVNAFLGGGVKDVFTRHFGKLGLDKLLTSNKPFAHFFGEALQGAAGATPWVMQSMVDNTAYARDVLGANDRDALKYGAYRGYTTGMIEGFIGQAYDGVSDKVTGWLGKLIDKSITNQVANNGLHFFTHLFTQATGEAVEEVFELPLDKLGKTWIFGDKLAITGEDWKETWQGVKQSFGMSVLTTLFFGLTAQRNTALHTDSERLLQRVLNGQVSVEELMEVMDDVDEEGGSGTYVVRDSIRIMRETQAAMDDAVITQAAEEAVQEQIAQGALEHINGDSSSNAQAVRATESEIQILEQEVAQEQEQIARIDEQKRAALYNMISNGVSPETGAARQMIHNLEEAAAAAVRRSEEKTEKLAGKQRQLELQLQQIEAEIAQAKKEMQAAAKEEARRALEESRKRADEDIRKAVQESRQSLAERPVEQDVADGLAVYETAEQGPQPVDRIEEAQGRQYSVTDQILWGDNDQYAPYSARSKQEPGQTQSEANRAAHYNFDDVGYQQQNEVRKPGPLTDDDYVEVTQDVFNTYEHAISELAKQGIHISPEHIRSRHDARPYDPIKVMTNDEYSTVAQSDDGRYIVVVQSEKWNEYREQENERKEREAYLRANGWTQADRDWYSDHKGEFEGVPQGSYILIDTTKLPPSLLNDPKVEAVSSAYAKINARLEELYRQRKDQQGENSKADLEKTNLRIEVLENLIRMVDNGDRTRFMEQLNRFRDRLNLANQQTTQDKTPATPGVRHLHHNTKLTATQRTDIDVLDNFAKRYGFQIDLVDDLPEGNGKYTGGRKITISINAQDQAYIQVAMHEMIHHIKNVSLEAYQRLEDVVLKNLNANGNYNLEQEIQKRMAEYQGVQTLDRQSAIEEIVAEAIPSFMGNKDAVRAFAMQDRGFTKKLKDFLVQMADRLKGIIERYAKNSNRPEIEASLENARNGMDTLNEYAQTLQQALDETQFMDGAEVEQFSVSKPVEKKGELIAVHGLTWDKLMAAWELGGASSPSIAVMAADMVDDGHGEISIVVDSSVVDPQADPRNRLYGGDAHTPVFTDAHTYKKSAAQVYVRLTEKISDTLPKDDPIRKEMLRNADTIMEWIENGDPYDKVLNKSKILLGLKLIYLGEVYGPDFYNEFRAAKSDLDYEGLRSFIADRLKNAGGYDEWASEILADLDPDDTTYVNIKRNTGLTSYHIDNWSEYFGEYTPDNISTSMYVNARERATGTGVNPHEILFAARRKYDSIEEARSEYDRFGRRDDNSEILSAAEDKITDAMRSLIANNRGLSERVLFDQLRTLAESGQHSIDAVLDYFKRDTIERTPGSKERFFLTITHEEAQKISEALETMRDLPTAYMEAKPAYGVGFDKFLGVAVPDYYSDAKLDQLAEMFEYVVLYRGGNKQSKSDAMNSIPHARFSTTMRNQIANEEMAAILDGLPEFSMPDRSPKETEAILDAASLGIDKYGEWHYTGQHHNNKTIALDQLQKALNQDNLGKPEDKRVSFHTLMPDGVDYVSKQLAQAFGGISTDESTVYGEDLRGKKHVLPPVAQSLLYAEDKQTARDEFIANNPGLFYANKTDERGTYDKLLSQIHFYRPAYNVVDTQNGFALSVKTSEMGRTDRKVNADIQSLSDAARALHDMLSKQIARDKPPTEKQSLWIIYTTHDENGNEVNHRYTDYVDENGVQRIPTAKELFGVADRIIVNWPTEWSKGSDGKNRPSAMLEFVIESTDAYSVVDYYDVPQTAAKQQEVVGTADVYNDGSQAKYEQRKALTRTLRDELRRAEEEYNTYVGQKGATKEVKLKYFHAVCEANYNSYLNMVQQLSMKIESGKMTDQDLATVRALMAEYEEGLAAWRYALENVEAMQSGAYAGADTKVLKRYNDLVGKMGNASMEARMSVIGSLRKSMQTYIQTAIAATLPENATVESLNQRRTELQEALSQVMELRNKPTAVDQVAPSHLNSEPLAEAINEEIAMTEAQIEILEQQPEQEHAQETPDAAPDAPVKQTEEVETPTPEAPHGGVQEVEERAEQLETPVQETALKQEAEKTEEQKKEEADRAYLRGVIDVDTGEIVSDPAQVTGNEYLDISTGEYKPTNPDAATDDVPYATSVDEYLKRYKQDISMDIGEIDSPDTHEQYAATAKTARQAIQNLTYRIDEMQEYLSSGAAPEGERASIEAAKRQYIDRRNKYKEFVRKLDKALAESEYLTADSVRNIAQHAIMTGDIDWESSDVRAADIKARRERDVATIRSRMQEVLGGDKSRPLTLDELADILDTDGLRQTMTRRYQVGHEIYNRMRQLTEEQQDLERRREELEGLNEKEGTTNERSLELGQIYKRQLDIEQYLKNAERVSRMYFDSGSALTMRDILSGKDGGKLPLVVMNEVFAMLQEAEAQLSAKGKSTNRAGWKNNIDEAHRVIESATGEFAPIFNALYISPVMKANAEIGREFGDIEQRLKDSGITKKNEAIAFRYAEGKITEEQFRTMIPDAKEREAVLRGLDVYREVYDELFARVNAALKRNGLDEIPYRQKYFHHMRETQGLIAKAASMLGIHIDDDTLPTSLAGKTDELKPRHNYMSAAEERHGDETAYTLHYNTASYAQTALRVIHQTDNITRLRQLEGYSGETVNKAAVNAGIRQYADLSRSGESTKDGRKQAYSSLVEWLSKYTDGVAGKKVGYMDRAAAGDFGRNALQVVGGLTSLRGSAITGFNIKSALSNSLSIMTAASAAPKETMAALGEAYDAFFKMHDWRDFEASSDFLSSRFSGGIVSDHLIERYKQTGQIPAEIVDRFAAHVAVRAFYKVGRNRGWGHEVAMKFADETALRMMASRNKGEGSNHMNSTVMGAALQFSREGINNIQFLMHDLPRFHNGDPKKVLASLIGLNILNWLYNMIFGTNTAPEIVSPALESVREWDGEKTVGANVLNTLGNYARALNPTNLGTGGYNDSAVENIPVVSGAKEVWEGVKSLISGDGFEALASAALGFVPGSVAADRFLTGAGDLMRGYSVDKNGNIRYVLHTDEFSGESVWDFIAAPLFGSTATTEGRKWKENGFDTMTKSMTEAFHDQTAFGQTNMEAYSTVTGYAEEKGSRNVSDMDLPDWFTDQADDEFIEKAFTAFNAGEITRPKDPPNSLSDSNGNTRELTDVDKQRYAELYADIYRNQIIMAGDGDLSGVAGVSKDLADEAFKDEKGW